MVLMKPALDEVAAVGKHRVRAGDFERRHFVSSQSDRRSRLDIVDSAPPRAHFGDLVVSHHFGDLHRGNILGMRQRIAQGHQALELRA